MKKEHKVLLMTVLVTLVIIAVINNVSSLKKIKETIYGNGWF
ncbi:hypothetical protein [Photobacterium sp. CCB-ST2H9]|nr:hypothetical protein [Photobacterium sp. CCB-ST2H9]